MAQRPIGVVVTGRTAHEVLTAIDDAERLGIPAAWMTSGGASPDAMTVFAAAAARTQRVKFGTAIVPTFPRHPLAMAQQAQVVASLAPGRFRLGVGPSHRPLMEALGIPFRSPLTHLREYVLILKALLQAGKVDFEGEYYRAQATIPQPVDVPVMASALRRGAFELCGAVADGAISWVCPGNYLRDVALPAMRAGASRARRPTPPLIAHAPVCVHEDAQEVQAAVRQQIMNPRLPFYQRMFQDAGFPEAAQGAWSDGMIDATVLWGDEARVAAGLEGLLALGAAEVLVSPLAVGKEQKGSLGRTMRLLGRVASGAAG